MPAKKKTATSPAAPPRRKKAGSTSARPTEPAVVDPPSAAKTPSPPKSAEPASKRRRAGASTTRGSKPGSGDGKKLSALDAAAKVLQESGRAMGCKEVIEAMAAKGYWTSPGGKTPEATLCSAILRATKTRGAQSRFTRAQRGKFALGAAS